MRTPQRFACASKVLRSRPFIEVGNEGMLLSRRSSSIACGSSSSGGSAAARCSMVVPASTSRSVAVIGAGAAGLASIRELLRAGHQVTAFEQSARPGGVWIYDADTDSDPLGAAESRTRIHSSMYRDLRTNLPREVMGFRDAPFTPALMGSRSVDARRFCSHAEVLAYLDCFAERHQLHQHVRFSTEVLRITPLDASTDAGPRWRLESVTHAPGGASADAPAPTVQSQEFDAVLVCNGHYSEPNLPRDVPGADAWPGQQLHSHNYRVPEAFPGVVVVVGASNSGEDVCREVAAVSRQVVLAARSWKDPAWASDATPFGPRRNISRRGMVSALHPDGRVDFTQGPSLPAADAIIYCTGYVYRFRMLEHVPALAGLSGQQYVPGLYRHMFVPRIGPSLAFIGLPWRVVPFPQFELQAALVARLLSGQASLPSAADMEADTAQHYAALAAAGVPLRHAHMMDVRQWAYNDWLADAAGVPRLPGWRPAMYAAVGASKRAHPDDYRDRWEDAESAADAAAELTQLAQQLRPELAAGAGTGVCV